MEALPVLKSIFNFDFPESNDSPHDRFCAVITALDVFPGLLKEVFLKTRSYSLGLEFFDICYQEINQNRGKIEEWLFDRYREYLITLRLHMLDGLNMWQEYIDFSDWVIEIIKLPYRFNIISEPDEKYKYTDEYGEHIHFLYREKTKYDITLRKLQKQAAGKNVEHLKKHQADELSDEDIQNRYLTVLQFFENAYNTQMRFRKQ